MKTKTIQLYEYHELSEKAKLRALRDWNENNDMPFLQSMLNDECGQLLKEHDIECVSNHPVCLYSLSHCQGDGLMFEGEFYWRGLNIKITHSGHYYHKYCRRIETIDKYFSSEQEEKEFCAIYESICDKLERYGYDIIDEETSEAHFIDLCNEMGYTFREDGTIENE